MLYVLLLDSEISSSHSPDASTTKSSVVCFLRLFFYYQYIILVSQLPFAVCTLVDVILLVRYSKQCVTSIAFL